MADTDIVNAATKLKSVEEENEDERQSNDYVSHSMALLEYLGQIAFKHSDIHLPRKFILPSGKNVKTFVTSCECTIQNIQDCMYFPITVFSRIPCGPKISCTPHFFKK
jgi:hypothetical protein